jgi:hypothetical protein
LTASRGSSGIVSCAFRQDMRHPPRWLAAIRDCGFAATGKRVYRCLIAHARLRRMKKSEAL